MHQLIARRRQAGYSLVEIMVTMIVMGIGLLGIAGLIVTNLKNNQGSYSRSQASVLVNDIVDRMRANRVTAEADPSPYTLAIDATPDPDSGVAGADLDEWRKAVEASLPAGRSAVAFDAATSNVTVTLEWSDARGSSDGRTVGLAREQYVFETRL